MIRKKNRFFTFVFSLLPGAGQMYMGFMKRGLSLMSSFVMIIFISVWLNASPIMFIALIAWFYSFFDTHNLRSIPDEEFYALEDNYILFPEFLKVKTHLEIQKKYRNIIAVALIVMGFTILWNNIYYIIRRVLPYYIADMLYSFGQYIPQLVIGVAIILFGLYLIRGKKQELDQEEKQLRITEHTNEDRGFRDNTYSDNISGSETYRNDIYSDNIVQDNIHKEDVSSDKGGNLE